VFEEGLTKMKNYVGSAGAFDRLYSRWWPRNSKTVPNLLASPLDETCIFIPTNKAESSKGYMPEFVNRLVKTAGSFFRRFLTGKE